jgi:hypothetical protein
LRNVLLPDHFIERSGAISASQDGVGHGTGECSTGSREVY